MINTFYLLVKIKALFKILKLRLGVFVNLIKHSLLKLLCVIFLYQISKLNSSKLRFVI
jgi:hypothetical protein